MKDRPLAKVSREMRSKVKRYQEAKRQYWLDRFSLGSLMTKEMGKAYKSAKSIDRYGEPISLHYQGETNFKTCSGALLSAMFYFIILSFVVIKGTEVYRRDNWSVV